MKPTSLQATNRFTNKRSTTRHLASGRFAVNRCLSVQTLALLSVSFLFCSCTQAQTTPTGLRFDFGNADALQTTYIVADTQRFDAQRKYGWSLASDLFMRDRQSPDLLRRDFVGGKSRASFRVSGLVPGKYLLTVVSGDSEYGDHRTQVIVNGAAPMPILEPATGEFATLTATINCGETCDVIFDSPSSNWVVNALSLQPTSETRNPSVTITNMNTGNTTEASVPASNWKVSPQDPTQDFLAKFNKSETPKDFIPSKLSRADYLKLITGEVDFWKTKQDVYGAIIDPYRNEEFQYSTPAYAHAAAALIAWDNRSDLIESASKAMDWATLRLSQRKAANGHEDFYGPMLAHALKLLKPKVEATRFAQWEANLKRFDPSTIYRMAPGSSNWNIVSLSGEVFFQQMDIRPKENDYVERSLAAQGRVFRSPYGLYLEGPMAYDLFPRIWLADILANGYSGVYSTELNELMRRGALTSLFMQSPWGELPAGGRSAHHQWNEAEQCLIYEIYAAQALKQGDSKLAGAYKRAAHLSLASMQRWVRPSGEMQIIKNWVDPAQNHAYESYSGHSQYNLLPMAMLAIAYEHAGNSENVAEQPAPSEVGGYVLPIAELHKVFANVSGTYVELDINADHHYDATGLIRVHMKGVSPQLGPSDSIMESPSYRLPADRPKAQNTGVGVSWQDQTGAWRRLGELANEQIKNVKVETLIETPQKVAFDVIYEGDLFGISKITEHYVITEGKVELSTELEGYKGPLRYVWPVLADDGRTQSVISTTDGKVSVSMPDTKIAQTFFPVGAQSVNVEVERYPNHNGWSRLGVAEYPNGGKITLVIASQGL